MNQTLDYQKSPKKIFKSTRDLEDIKEILEYFSS